MFAQKSHYRLQLVRTAGGQRKIVWKKNHGGLILQGSHSLQFRCLPRWSQCTFGLKGVGSWRHCLSAPYYLLGWRWSVFDQQDL